jgi:hypothetical protein
MAQPMTAATTRPRKKRLWKIRRSIHRSVIKGLNLAASMTVIAALRCLKIEAVQTGERE